MTSAYNIIRDAILRRQQVIAYYKNHLREMCPHAIGTKNGIEHALFYQFGGTSGSKVIEPDGSHANWRCMQLNLSSQVTVQQGAWHTALGGGHSRRESCIDWVDVEVPHQ